MSRKKTGLTGVSGADVVTGAGMASAPTTRHNPYTTANAPGAGIDRGGPVRATHALLGI